MRFILLLFLLFNLTLPTTGQIAKTDRAIAKQANYQVLGADLALLKEQFNRDRGKTRLLLLLSPA